MNLKSFVSSKGFKKIILILFSICVLYFTLKFLLADLINNCNCLEH